MKRLWFMLLALIVLLIPAQADEEQVKTFESGGLVHAVRYVTSREALVAPIISAIQQATLVYQKLFDLNSGQISFTVVVDVVDKQAKNAKGNDLLGDARGNLPASQFPLAEIAPAARFCHIRLYNTADLNDQDTLQNTTAHELAHCYQYRYMPLSITSSNRSWWAEGSAEWLTALVYPSTVGNYLGSTGVKNKFVSNHAHNLLKNAYENFYFWQFLASGEGLGNPGILVSMLKQVPPDNYIAYLNDQIPDLDEAFHKFALAIWQDKLQYQPLSTELRPKALDSKTFPEAIDLITEPLSINYSRVGLRGDSQGKVVVVTANALTNTGTEVSLFTNDQMQRLSEGSPVELCPATDEIVLIYSRNENSTTEAAAVNFALGDADCIDEVRPLAQIPACLVGVWNIVALPPSIPPIDLTGGVYQFILVKTNTWRGLLNITMSGTAQEMEYIVTLDMELGGTLQLAEYQGYPDRFMVYDYTSALEPGSTGEVSIDGVAVDISEDLEAAYVENSAFYPEPTYLRCVSETQIEYVVAEGDYAGTWHLERAP